MPIDVARHIGAITRELSTRDKDGAPAKVVTATRRFDTDADDLWDALTNAERLPRWFLPVSGDLRLGGRYQLEGNAGGEILVCEPPRRLGVTWEWQEHVSWLNVELTDEADGGTLLSLEHVAHVPDEMWEQFGPGATGLGWDSALLGLALHLAGDASITPDQAMAWMVSEEGQDFFARSSRAWRDAQVAAGEDPAAAAAAAERTRAAWAGEEPDAGG